MVKIFQIIIWKIFQIISPVLDDRALEYVTKEYVLEIQEEKTIIKKTTLNYDPKIVETYPFYSSPDTSEHLSQQILRSKLNKY